MIRVNWMYPGSLILFWPLIICCLVLCPQTVRSWPLHRLCLPLIYAHILENCSSPSGLFVLCRSINTLSLSILQLLNWFMVQYFGSSAACCSCRCLSQFYFETNTCYTKSHSFANVFSFWGWPRSFCHSSQLFSESCRVMSSEGDSSVPGVVLAEVFAWASLVLCADTLLGHPKQDRQSWSQWTHQCWLTVRTEPCFLPLVVLVVSPQ